MLRTDTLDVNLRICHYLVSTRKSRLLDMALGLGGDSDVANCIYEEDHAHFYGKALFTIIHTSFAAVSNHRNVLLFLLCCLSTL